MRVRRGALLGGNRTIAWDVCRGAAFDGRPGIWSARGSATNPSDFFQLPRAVADALGGDAHAIEQGEVEIGHRRFFVELEMAARAERAAALAGKEDGKVVVIVAVAVADGAAINDHAIIEERTFAFLHRFE